MKKLITIVLWTGILLAIALTCFSGTLSPGHKFRLDNAMDKTAQIYKLKGATYAVKLPCYDVHKGATGISHIAMPMMPDMVMGINSVTKTYTATAILKLYEQGLLSLEDSIGKWVDPHPFIDPGITIRQLLNHTSGLYSFNEHPDYMDSILKNTSRVWSAAEMLQFVKHPHFSKGKSWKYSNTNYLLLGMIIEEITGQPLNVAYKTILFQPLGLSETFLFGYDNITGTQPHQWSLQSPGSPMVDVTAMGYNNTAFLTSAGGTGGLMATASDVALFVYHLMKGDIISKSSLDEMLEFLPTGQDYYDYGLGISRYQNTTKASKHVQNGNFIHSNLNYPLRIINGRPLNGLAFNGNEIYSHGGKGIGYINCYAVDPVTGVTIVINTNQDSINNYELIYDFLDALYIEAMSIYYELQATQVTIDTIKPISNQNFHSLTGSGGLFEALNNGTLSGIIHAKVHHPTIESGQHPLLEISENSCGAKGSLIITPADSFHVKTFSGNYNGWLIRLAGADRVIIDGRFNNSTRRLFRFINQSNQGGVFLLDNQANYNEISFSVIISSATQPQGATTRIVNKSSRNIFLRNQFEALSANIAPSTHIVYSQNKCSNNTFVLNNIISFADFAILLDSLSGIGWKIDSNLIYSIHRIPRSQTIIGMLGGDRHIVSGNYMGGLITNSGNIPLINNSSNGHFRAVHSNLKGKQVFVLNNTITNIRFSIPDSARFTGIHIQDGSAEISGNIIGGLNNNSQVVITGGTGNKGALQCGILAEGEGHSKVINNSVQLITSNSPGVGSQLFGIFLRRNSGKNIVDKNVVRDLISNSRRSFVLPGSQQSKEVSLAGIIIDCNNGNSDVTRNIVCNLTSNANLVSLPTAVIGIGIDNMGTGGDCAYNKIYNLFNQGVSANVLCGIAGIRIAENDPIALYNNSVSVINTGYPSQIHGMLFTKGNHALIHNTIFIGGILSENFIPFTSSLSIVGNSTKAKALNNIFYNESTSNPLGLARRTCVFIENATNIYESNFNNYYCSYLPTTISSINAGLTLGEWIVASGNDANSTNRLVLFHNTTDLLKPVESTNCWISNTGTPSTVRDDIVHYLRHAITPDVGCYEWNYNPIVDVTSNSPVCLVTPNNPNGTPIVLTANTSFPAVAYQW
ncbi:MAG: beta-lactamase family protein, partial [Chitinophagales bacterium]|nr:beta-lactamase family protein [Chitinophagales bacterium]